MKIVFFGTSNYCLPILETLHQNFDLSLVVTRPDKPVGRNKSLTPSATKLWAETNKISVLTPATLKKDTADRTTLESKLKEISPDLAIVSDFGLIIPRGIFTCPHQGTLNIHFSHLPELRGPSPVQFTLLRGDPIAWITIFKLENPPELEIKMDSGPVVWQKSFPIDANDTTPSLYTRLFQEAAQALPEAINSQHSTPQDHALATYCRFLTKEDGFIDWKILQKISDNQPLNFEELPQIQQEALATRKISNFQFQISNLYDFYRAVTPWPGVWTIDPQGKRLKLLKISLTNEKEIFLEVLHHEGQAAAQQFSSPLRQLVSHSQR